MFRWIHQQPTNQERARTAIARILAPRSITLEWIDTYVTLEGKGIPHDKTWPYATDGLFSWRTHYVYMRGGTFFIQWNETTIVAHVTHNVDLRRMQQAIATLIAQPSNTSPDRVGGKTTLVSPA